MKPAVDWPKRFHSKVPLEMTSKLLQFAEDIQALAFLLQGSLRNSFWRHVVACFDRKKFSKHVSKLGLRKSEYS